jgi:hypothetical protein
MRTGPDTVSWRAAGGADRNDRSSARKVKILTTIPQGTSRNLFEDFTTGEELDQLRLPAGQEAAQ